ncbi:MAG: hypothetical protein PVI21_01815 [Candidatus Woesebacteria bacterium]|jgi:hypothetical protein
MKLPCCMRRRRIRSVRFGTTEALLCTVGESYTHREIQIGVYPNVRCVYHAGRLVSIRLSWLRGGYVFTTESDDGTVIESVVEERDIDPSSITYFER